MTQDPKNYFVYLPSTPERSRWGVEILGAGFTDFPPKKGYPPEGHPSDHSFDFKKGRTLRSFQILCITSGQRDTRNSFLFAPEDHCRHRLPFISRRVAHVQARPQDRLGRALDRVGWIDSATVDQRWTLAEEPMRFCRGGSHRHRQRFSEYPPDSSGEKGSARFRDVRSRLWASGLVCGSSGARCLPGGCSSQGQARRATIVRARCPAN